MNQDTGKILRKVSKTGILSYQGCKYYVKDIEFKNRTVQVVSENEDQTLSIEINEFLTALAFPIQLVKR